MQAPSRPQSGRRVGGGPTVLPGRLSTGTHRYPPDFLRGFLDRLANPTHECLTVLVLVRLRSLFFEVCADHAIAVCENCHEGYKPDQLQAGLGTFFLCRTCGAHLGESLKAHARTCPQFLVPKPLAKIDRPGLTPSARPRSIAVTPRSGHPLLPPARSGRGTLH